jgi:2-(1,2-epoxy-1,2-dihydrophenyl)acetyl-CoA isomerase
MPGETPTEAPILLSERRDGLLVLTLNRPERLNALSPELHEALDAALEAASHDPEVRAVVLTGAGRAFCSGGDLSGDRTRPRPKGLEGRADHALRNSLASRLLHDMPKPTLALMNGPTAGAGLALALACDLRLTVKDAVITTAFAPNGLSGDMGVSYFIAKLCGPAKARELMWLSEKLDGAEALAAGLVNRVYDDAPTLMAEGMAIARRLATGPALAYRYIKQNLMLAESENLEQVLRAEAFAMARSGGSEDVKEAALARREKRPPVFKGY